MYLFQYHVEKAPYAWKTLALHTIELVELSQQVTNQFVRLALKNENSF